MPPSSNERSSRSSKRSRKSKRRSRSRSRDQLAAKGVKSLAANGIDFFAMLLGLIAASVVAFLGWSYLFSSSPALELDQKDESQVAKQVLDADARDFRELLEASKLEQQLRMLTALNRLANQPAHEDDVKVQRRRIQVADRMMGETLDNQQRYLAVSSKLDAEMTLHQLIRKHGLNEPSVKHQLLDDVEQYRNDRDERLAIQSRMLLVQLSGSAIAPDTPLIAKELYALAMDFPEKVEIHTLLKRTVEEQMEVPEKREAGGRLVKRLLRLKDQDKDSKVEASAPLRKIFQGYQDWAALGENEFFKAWDSRSFSGEISYGKLRDVTLQLTAIDDPGEKVLSTVRMVANWFEQSREYEFAMPIYQALIDEAPKYQNVLIGKAAGILGNQGLKRCRLVKQPFEIVGQRLSGESLDVKPFQNRVVVIVFFSLASERSVEALDYLRSESSAWKGKPVKQIAVCIDQRDAPVFDTARLDGLVELLKDWEMVVRDEDGNLPIFDQCPATTFPRIVLLDKQQRVYDVDVQRNNVRAQIDYVLISDELE